MFKNCKSEEVNQNSSASRSLVTYFLNWMLDLPSHRTANCDVLVFSCCAALWHGGGAPIPSQGNSTAGSVTISELITLVSGTLQTKLQCGLFSKSLNHLCHHLNTGALAMGLGLWIPIINQKDSCLLAWGSPFLPFIIPSRSGVLTGVVTMASTGWQL